MNKIHKKYHPDVIMKYIEEYVTTDYRISANGKWVNINSEFTYDEKYRMGFNLEESYVNDFKMGSMSLIKFVAEHENIEEINADLLLFNISNKLKKGFLVESKRDKEDIHIAAVDCPKLIDIPDTKSFNKPSLIREKAYQYLLNRGITDKHIKKYSLGYSDTKKCSKCHGEGYDNDYDQCPMCNGTGANFFYSRIIIPSYEKGNLVYLQGRTINENTNELRYQNIKAPRIQVVYFYDLLKENEDIFITEGPIDAMTLYDYNVTSLLNTKISEPQIIKILKKNPPRIFFILDHDETKAKRARLNKIVADNIKKIMYLSDNKVSVGIYDWPKMLKDKGLPIKKDINANQITYVDEKYLITYSELSLKDDTEQEQKSVF